MGKTRPWKTAKTGAASSTINVSKCGSGLKPSWDQRMKERAARAAVQAAQREVDEQIRQEKREIRERREEKQRRKEENRAKGTSFQVVRRAHLARPRRRARRGRLRTRGRRLRTRGRLCTRDLLTTRVRPPADHEHGEAQAHEQEAAQDGAQGRHERRRAEGRRQASHLPEDRWQAGQGQEVE